MLNASHQIESDSTCKVDQRLGAITAGRRLQKQLAAHARRAGISESEFLLLWGCFGATAPSQKELAARLAMSTAQVSGLVESLRLRGLLSSRRAAADRRRQEWSLTDAGRAVVHQVRDAWARAEADAEMQLRIVGGAQ